MTFIPWPEIESFHNIRKYTVDGAHPEILNGQSVVHYRPKVKLHGMNAAIQIHEDGSIVCQSREAILSLEKDNAGFARWVSSNVNWQKLLPIIVFGEWIGPGIQKGVAVSTIPQKSFAIFAARSFVDPNALLVDPEKLKVIFPPNLFPNTYVLPWYNEGLEIDWSSSTEELSKKANLINEWVETIETNDPWVEKTFGIKGTGEGLVFYPQSNEHLGHANFVNLVFKAKGEKHKNIATAKPAQVDASVAASIEAFVEMVLTPARLEQGVSKISSDGSFDLKSTGKFITWVSGDVEKEAQDELAASNLTWKQVQKAVGDAARNWYLKQTKGKL